MALVVCYICSSTVEDFTTSSYRLVGPHVTRICADCAQRPTATELASVVYKPDENKLVYSTKEDEQEREELENSMLGLVQNEDGTWQIDESLIWSEI